MQLQKFFASLIALVLLSVQLSAQTISADRLYLNDGPCGVTSSNGSPDKLVLSPCPVITTDAATNLTLAPTGDIVLGPVGVDVLPNTGYTVNLGALTNKYLTLHAAELWVETLVAQNTIATIGGRIIVGPTTTLTADIPASATTIFVKHNQMSNGDRVYLEANGAVEFMAITSSASGSGPYSYTVTRNLDGSGANDWAAGDAVLNTGTTGKGLIDLYSTFGILSGSGPTIVGNVRTGTSYNAISQRWAIGNLNGTFNYGTEVYGAAFGDASNTNVTVDATNGFRIRSGTTNKFLADTSGNLSIVGDLTVGTAGVVHSAAASSLTSGDGFYIAGGSSPAFRVGNPSGNYVSYDASTGVMTIVGDVNLRAGSVDNVIKSGAFEGASAAEAFLGWQRVSSSVTAPVQSCCGTNGPGTMYHNPGNGQQSFGLYRAIPVTVGQTFRVYADAYVGTTTTAGIHMSVRESTSANVDVTYVDGTGTGSVVSTSTTTLYAGGGTGGAFAAHEFTYTVPSGVRWVSLLIGDVTGSLSASTYTDLHFDNVQMQTQLGAGHLRAGSIDADRITAGSITATQIAANTITASEIAASTIDVSRLNVTDLSAITANMGTITAGSITIGGSDKVWISDNGISSWVVAVGGSTRASAPFRIADTGAVTATNTRIEGLLTVTGIGGFGTAGYLCVDVAGQVYRGATCP